MNLFENLQIMKESGNLMSNDEFVKNECEKYGINEYSYGTNYKMLDLDPTDSSAEEFINKIEADGYKFIEEQKDGVKNHESENDVTLVYGKEVEGNRCIIAISIHPSENYVVVSCGYDEEEHDNEFFENLYLMKEQQNNFKSRDDLINEIDKYYNKPGYIGDLSQNYKGTNMEWYKFVEEEIEKITGKSAKDLPDNDPSEGFYSNLSTSELRAVLNNINATIAKLTKDNKITIELTNRELNLIKTAIEMWTDANFSKSREESDIAKDILNKLK